MTGNYLIKSVDASNVDEHRFFCYMSKPKSPGYRQKREWLQARFAEGMRIKILQEVGGRDVAFIEYLPGEYAWRAVHAPGYMVIHCLWVVGKGKDKGYGSRLIQECLGEARTGGKHGVAMLTSDRVWLADKRILLKNGFEQVDQAPPCFQLMVVRFGSGPEPKLPQDWEQRTQAFGSGLTVVRTPQCPYNENGANNLLEFAREKGIPARIVELTSAREVQERSPSVYGTFGSVLDGRTLAYHYLLRKDFEKLILEREKGN
jgi:GNAT superfamily N-acetyltransferase